MSNDMILRPQNFDQLAMFARMAANSAMVPQQYRNKPEDIMLAVQMGSEVGLAPMQALQNIAIINGKPSVYGDALLGLCKAHPLWDGFKEWTEGQGEAMEAFCVVKRKGDEPAKGSFSVADAKKAALWGKSGPWSQYPKRMLQMRARGFACRDAFPDALKGIISAEEAGDMPKDTFVGTTIQGEAEPAAGGTRDAINAAVPLKETVLDSEADKPETPEQKARLYTNKVLAKIASAATEDAVHEIRGDAGLQKWLDWLKTNFPAMEEEITTAFASAFRAFHPAQDQPARETVDDVLPSEWR